MMTIIDEVLDRIELSHELIKMIINRTKSVNHGNEDPLLCLERMIIRLIGEDYHTTNLPDEYDFGDRLSEHSARIRFTTDALNARLKEYLKDIKKLKCKVTKVE